MASIPLPALDVKAPQQQDLLQKFGQLQQLQNMRQQSQMQQQEAPLRMQALQQQTQSGDIQLQQEQQAQKDQAAFRAAMASPDMKGKTIGEVADVLGRQGNLSPATWQQLKKADIDTRTSLATLDDKQLANMKAAHEQTQQLYNNVMDMPDDQLAANWPSIAQQYDAIPGNNKQPLDPNQPLTKQQLQQFGPVISLNEAYLNQALERKKAATAQQLAEVDLQTKQQGLQYGPTGPAADSKYRSLQMKLALKQPITTDDQAWMKGYEKQKLLVPATTANIRVEGYGQTKEYPVFDHKTGLTVMVTPTEINRASAAEPGRYSPASYAPESLGAKDTTNYFTKGKGGQQVTAFNTAIDHLSTLNGLANDLGNSNIQIFNRAAQAWAQQTGNPAPTNFAAAKNAMAGEVASALKASGATDQEIEKVDQTFDRAQSPGQLKGAIATYRTLLNGKMANLKKQYGAGMQGKPAFSDQPDNGSQAPSQSGSGLGVKLSDAMSLPQNRGKSQQQVIQDIQAHGHTVIQ